MLSRPRLVIAAVLAAVLVAVVAAGGWYFFIRDDAPPPVNLEGAVASTQATATATPASTPAATTPTATATTEATPTRTATAAPTPTATPTPPAATPAAEAASARPEGELTGVWTLSDRGESFAGYRVREELATVGATTAAGRSSAITASLQFDGSAITAVEVEVDMTQLRSDQSRRDGALRQQAIETNTYPTSSFALTEPIPLDGVPVEGETISVTAVGDLTLHGVTRQVEIPLEGQLTDGLVVVIASIEIVFADYDIEKPRAGIVISVEDRGIMEFQLVFE